MDFHPVKPGLDGVDGRLTEIRHDAGDLGGLQRARRRAGHHAALAVRPDLPHLPREGHRRRRHRQGAGVEIGVRHAPAVPDLQEDAPARAVHRVGDPPPAGDLRRAVDARSEGVALGVRRDVGGLGHDQPRACPLGVVGGVQRGGHVARLARPGAGEGRHRNAVGKGQPADAGWLEEQSGHGGKVQAVKMPASLGCPLRFDNWSML